MALEMAFQNLRDRLRSLEESLEELRSSVLHSKPAESRAGIGSNREKEHYLADRLWEVVAEMQGRLREASTAAEEAKQAVAPPVNLDRAWRMLKACHEAINMMAREYASEMFSYERVSDLMTLRAEHSDWAGWVDVQLSHLDRFGKQINDASETCLTCWQEIAERVGMTSVSVQTTNIGQQISAAELAEK
jgi:hypothetical protein